MLKSVTSNKDVYDENISTEIVWGGQERNILQWEILCDIV